MNRSTLAVLIGALMATGTVQAAAQDNTWYVGGKAGWSNFYGVDYDEQVEALVDIFDPSKDHSDLGLGVFAGYQVNQNVAVELGYDWLGKYEVDQHFAGNGVDTGLQGEAKAQMIQATMKIGFPATEALELYGRLGGAYAWTDSSLKAWANDGTSNISLSGDGKYHGAAFVGALGMEYAIDKDWAARLEYQYTTPLGKTSLDESGIEMDNGLLSVGMLYRFGQVGDEPVAPTPAPEPAPAPVLVEKQFSLDSDVLFEFNKATLKPAASQALDKLFADILAANPKDGVATVIGHTDRLGSDAYNQTLSEQRARTVADYLIAKGLFADKVRAEGRGESSPVTGGSCPDGAKAQMIACLAPDRRVEVRLTGVSQVAE
ncbi:porin OmpA [Aeromonas caviae]|uniref:porin OmpA n=1 Tax=Aeromonas sp. SrichE-2G TaxID=2823359 RepID=UPI001B342D05|nr:porin OmpA [Aeromonas sp. SrichE-2G]MBP4042037.1 porin OmpA [Aeromonas sp. SrichE-2G]